jgi:hypothetical protein
MEDDESVARRWVKRTPAPLAPTSSNAGPVHPQQRAAAFREDWNKVWRPAGGSPPSLADLERWLNWVPEGGWAPAAGWASMELSAPALVRLARKQIGKAMGLDGWAAADLLRLPPDFWERLASTWNRFLHGERLPALLAQIRTVGLDKPEGGQRPISLAAVAWRICNTALIGKLADWVEQWAPPELTGGLRGRSSEEVHASLLHRLQTAHRLGETFSSIKEDIQKAFDSIWIDVVEHIVRRFGMPEGLSSYVRCFYELQERWMEAAGATATQPISPERSILQGCPLSCIWMAAVMTIWVVALREIPQIECKVYVDDRIVSTTDEEPLGPLTAASERSDEVDSALGLTKHPGKKRAASTTARGRKQLAPLKDRVGKAEAKMEVLGILYAYGRQQVQAFKPVKLAEARRRLRRTGKVSRSPWLKRSLIRQLVLPMITWQGAWARPKVSTLNRLRCGVERAVLGGMTESRSRFILWTADPALGPGLDPAYQYDLAALRFEVWRARRRLAHPTEPGLTDPPPRMMTVAQQWGWLHEGGSIWRTPEGEIDFGWDGWKTLTSAAERGWQRLLWAGEDRVPGPEKRVPARPHPDVSVQRTWLAAHPAHMAPERRTALAAGLQGDTLALLKVRREGAHGRGEAPPPPLPCACGSEQATRRHLAWQCPLEPPRHEDRVPPGSAAEGLLVKLAPQPPPPLPLPVPRDQPEIPEDFVESLRDSARHHSGRALVASDGGSKGEGYPARCGSVGVAVRSSTGDIRGWRIARPGGDQTSYGAEFWGLWILTSALAAAAVPGDAWIDNLAIVEKGRAAWGGRWTDRRMPAAWWHLRERAQQLGASVVRWCPSHGKRADWRPPSPFNEVEIRALNARADEEASRELDAQWAKGQPARVGAEVIREWTMRALHRQHKGLVRQRQSAGFLGGSSEEGGGGGRGRGGGGGNT